MVKVEIGQNVRGLPPGVVFRVVEVVKPISWVFKNSYGIALE